jgi:hypothetical protein
MRLDLIFSNWVFIWFILYGFRLVPFNPSLILIASFAAVVFEVFILKYYGKKDHDLVRFIIINVVLIKMLPLLSLALTNDLSVTLQDAYFTVFIVLVYSLYLYANHINPYSYYKVLIGAYFQNEGATINNSPLSGVYNDLYDYVYTRII